LIINNDKLREMYGNLSLANAFTKADDILATAAKGIAEIITVTGYINVDFEDVKTVMTESGPAIMGSATAQGEGRALLAVEEALASPLLNDSNIKGANYILLYITSGADEVLMDEIAEITDYIQDEAGSTADIIWGTGSDESLGDSISVTLVATGFESSNEIVTEKRSGKKEDKVVHSLDDSVPQTNLEAEKEVIASTPNPRPVVEPKSGPVTYDLNNDTFPHTSASEVFNRQNISHTVNPNGFNAPTEKSEAPVTKYNLFEEEASTEVNDSEISNNLNETPNTPVVNEVRNDIQLEDESLKEKEFSAEEQLRKSQERIMRLKSLSMKMNTPSGINELENVPAYQRKNVQLNDVPHSSDSTESRYTLSQGEDNKTEIRPNNSFLHDNVD
jgi:cell division protein FtsZ